jgi:hypothetical protein
MKALKTASLVFLVVLFIGIAGGFTKTEYGWWSYGPENCSIPNTNSLHKERYMPQDILKKECEAVGGVWKKGEKYFIEADKIDQSYAPHQTKFDPKSTALFVIAGAIIALVGLEMRKKK